MRIEAEGIRLNEKAVQGSSLAGYAKCRPQHPLESQNFGTDHMAQRETPHAGCMYKHMRLIQDRPWEKGAFWDQSRRSDIAGYQ